MTPSFEKSNDIFKIQHNDTSDEGFATIDPFLDEL
jgi:hypothetical protein